MPASHIFNSSNTNRLPYVYRPNSLGQVSLVDNVKQGISLATAAYNLVQGGFSSKKVADAKVLIGGAKTFFAGLHHRGDNGGRPGELNQDGLGEEHFVEDWKGERKDVWMFSGCADHQTSADTSIAGAATGIFIFSLLLHSSFHDIKTDGKNRRNVSRFPLYNALQS